ncbi:MAG: hypothetical protein OHK005_09780 [Candidatus Methylacidiphilales bacterium]
MLTVDQLIELEIKARDLIVQLEEELATVDLAPPGKLDGTEGRLSRQDSLMHHQMDQEAQRRRQLRLNLLREAVKRMDAGTYGLCAACGHPIGFDRLDLQPETPLCAACAKTAS